MQFNLADLFEAIATAVSERPCIICRGRHRTFAEVDERSGRLAAFLATSGLCVERERGDLEPWESGQSHVALYLHNSPAYLESMLGAYKARAVPFNVNYRYVEDELLYLLRDAGAHAVIYHAQFAPLLASVRAALPGLRVLVQVSDDSGHELLPGAVDYDEVMASPHAEELPSGRSPDDLYMLYTGGTTGMPKGVLWRQSDIFMAALGGMRHGMGAYESVEEVVEVARGGGARYLPAPPFMHGAAHWAAFNAFHAGNTVVIQDDSVRFDAHDIWSTVERERVQILLIVGDAFARPLLDQLARHSYDLSTLALVVTGGAPLSPELKARLLEHLPGASVFDAIGSSETGSQAVNVSTKATGVSTGTFMPQPGNCVLDAACERVLEPGSDEMGWFAKGGHVPLGYLGDPDKTRRTFPAVSGQRYAVPGDRARHLADGMIQVLGRDSVTINSGGEKIFAEEVEQAVKRHAAVYDAIVVGRPSERWGQEVVALVSVVEGATVEEADLLEECARHLARYKLPKAVLFLDEIVRSPSGKPDYRWAKQVAETV